MDQILYYHLVKKIIKIGPADSEMIGLQEINSFKQILKKKDINASKTYSLPARHTKQSKLFVPLNR